MPKTEQKTAERLSHRVRRLRLARNLRLEDLALRTGYSKGFLSKIENAKASPPIATLMKLAGALGVDAAELLADDAGLAAPDASVHVKAGEGVEIVNEGAGPGYTFHALAAARAQKAMEPFLLIVRPEDVDPKKRFEHPGEEWIYVLEGQLEYAVGDEIFSMGPGDSLYFEATRPHAPLPQRGPVKLLAMFCNVPSRAGKEKH